ncbi:MAG: DegQ family serine endoprotease [Sphingomonadales bacterium]|nr:DegQ family serine endoprotease [Sphingomonadales bacterium]
MLKTDHLIRVIVVLIGISAAATATVIAQDQQDDPARRDQIPLDRLERVVPENRQQVQFSYAPLVKSAAPAVVNIYARRVVRTRSPIFDDSLFSRFFGRDGFFGMPRERVEGSLGSGVVVRDDGIIVTNNHVIGQAQSIRVVLADRREFDAEVIAADERTDLAILQIDTAGEMLPVLHFANSDAVEVGDIVLAIGNPFGVGQTVTSGIVSATARTQVGISDYQFFIQTDAAINPGNSGGALVGQSGELLGINTAIYSRSGGNNGIGFAIPANMVRSVVDAALGEGKIVRPWLGASGQAVTSELAESLGLDRPGGVLLDDVYPGGPADMAGLEAGDTILAVGENEILDSQGLRFRIATVEPESVVDFRVLRSGETYQVPVALTLPPEDPPRDLRLLEGRHPFQGVKVGNLSPAYAEELGVDPLLTGVIVVEIDRRSPAWRRQFLRPGDVILQLNETEIASTENLEFALSEPLENYVYRVRRGDRVFECGIIGGRSFTCRS